MKLLQPLRRYNLRKLEVVGRAWVSRTGRRLELLNENSKTSTVLDF
jgi:hypothetical protein